jgi:hypothetical protein
MATCRERLNPGYSNIEPKHMSLKTFTIAWSSFRRPSPYRNIIPLESQGRRVRGIRDPAMPLGLTPRQGGGSMGRCASPFSGGRQDAFSSLR